MSAEISLVQEIQKYPFLYNNNLPEYNRKDLTEEAWAQVALINNLTVSDCKEKWRNIRCSFLRSLKPTNKFKKPYYLTAYLQFILPYLKSINSLEIIEDIQASESVKNNSSKDLIIKQEQDEISEGQPEEESTLFRKRRRPASLLSKTFTHKNIIRSKYSHGHQPNLVTTDMNRSKANAMRYFLLSLMPELETISEEQIRLFKIKVMLLIDEIKTNETQIRQSINRINDSDRVQKRLINLLLRNLKKTSNR